MAYGTSSFYNALGPTIPGRFVNSPQDISPSEVPTNGSLCLFPKSDYSCIYARQWGANGIMEVTFVPERPPQIPQTQSNPEDSALAASIKSLEGMILELKESVSEYQQRTTKLEKELRKKYYSQRKEKQNE